MPDLGIELKKIENEKKREKIEFLLKE